MNFIYNTILSLFSSMTSLTNSKINIDDIKALTRTIREERNKNRYMIAAEQAKDTIVKNYQMKIQKAAESGSFHVDLYDWEFVKDKKDKRYCFNGVRISDILFREPTDHENKVLGKCLKDILEDEFKSSGFGFSIYSWRDSPNRKKSIRISWYDKKLDNTMDKSSIPINDNNSDTKSEDLSANKERTNSIEI